MSAEKSDVNRSIAELLLLELERQATKGGTSIPIIMSDSTSETAAGPYW